MHWSQYRLREGVSRGESICHDCENDLYFPLLLIPAPFPGEKWNVEQWHATTHYYTLSGVLHEKCFHPHKIFPKFKSMKKQPQPLLSTIMHSCWHDIMIEVPVTMQTPCSAIHWQSSALIAMKMTCCFYHVPSHGRPFFSLLLSWMLIYPTHSEFFCGFTSESWTYFWGLVNIHAYSSCYICVQVRWFLMFPDDKLH